MTHSINEIEALAKRAARGAGYPWGLAEDAAKATGWLCKRGLDGCAALAALLSRIDGHALSDWTPRISDGAFISDGGQLCPLIAGAAMADRARGRWRTDLHLSNVVAPVILLPFAGVVARRLEIAVTIRVGGRCATTDGVALVVEPGIAVPEADVILSLGGVIGEAPPLVRRAAPSGETLDTLTAMARRTYAPATEESRLKGAGAGLSDND